MIDVADVAVRGRVLVAGYGRGETVGLSLAFDGSVFVWHDLLSRVELQVVQRPNFHGQILEAVSE